MSANMVTMSVDTQLQEVLPRPDIFILMGIATGADDVQELANWYSAIAQFATTDLEAKMGMALCKEFLPEIREAQRTLDVVHPQFRTIRLHQHLRFRLDFLVSLNGLRIGVECDGKAYHSSAEQKARDEFRDRTILEKSGLRIIRFPCAEIVRNAAHCARIVRVEIGK